MVFPAIFPFHQVLETIQQVSDPLQKSIVFRCIV
jgi:hypothetical protein